MFSIQTGLLLHTAGNSFSYGDDWNIDFFVPVYASFHIPLSDKVNLRLNAGAYTGSGEYWNLGATAAAGIEVKRFYVGVNYFQNCVNDRDLKLGLSVGYKFTFNLLYILRIGVFERFLSYDKNNENYGVNK